MIEATPLTASVLASLANRNEGQMEMYLAKHIKAKDVEALQLSTGGGGSRR